MENMTWVTTWEQWRAAMGHRGSAQREAVMKFLETHPAILYWGDSWFSTPLYLNLARQSSGKINGLSMIIGKPGAEAAELFSEDNVTRYAKRVASSPFDLVCLSAGGNDCLDERLATVFSAWQGGSKRKIGASEAYMLMSRSTAFTDVYAAYDRLLRELANVQIKRPALRVIGHPYVPIRRIGAKAVLTPSNVGLIAWVKGEVGPWLWNRMENVLRDRAEGAEFARLILVEGFKDGVLGKLAKAYPGLFVVADFSKVRGHDQDGFWNDEIHPTQAGFLEVSTHLNDAIRSQLPTSKRAAVS